MWPTISTFAVYRNYKYIENDRDATSSNDAPDDRRHARPFFSFAVQSNRPLSSPGQVRHVRSGPEPCVRLIPGGDIRWHRPYVYNTRRTRRLRRRAAVRAINLRCARAFGIYPCRASPRDFSRRFAADRKSSRGTRRGVQCDRVFATRRFRPTKTDSSRFGNNNTPPSFTRPDCFSRENDRRRKNTRFRAAGNGARKQHRTRTRHTTNFLYTPVWGPAASAKLDVGLISLSVHRVATAFHLLYDAFATR